MKQNTNRHARQRSISVLTTNIGLIIVTITMILTGFVIQLEYHMDRLSPIVETWGFAYNNWSFFHKSSIVVFSFLMLFHIISHWKWYKIIVNKRLIAKNKQTIILSVIFILTAVTGYTAWFGGLTGGETSSNAMILRKTFIEIHDKLAIIFTIYIILHVIKRMKRI
jgi:hypothetical protein